MADKPELCSRRAQNMESDRKQATTNKHDDTGEGWAREELLLQLGIGSGL